MSFFIFLLCHLKWKLFSFFVCFHLFFVSRSVRSVRMLRQRNKSYLWRQKRMETREKTTNVNNFKLVQRSWVCVRKCVCVVWIFLLCWQRNGLPWVRRNGIGHFIGLFHISFQKIYIYPKKVIESLCTDYRDNSRPSTQSVPQPNLLLFLCLVFAPKTENNVRLRQRHSRCECDSHCIINRLLLEKLWHLAKWTENESSVSKRSENEDKEYKNSGKWKKNYILSLAFFCLFSFNYWESATRIY